MRYLSLHVDTTADSRGYPVPVTFSLHGSLFQVSYILDRWDGTDHCYFKVIADDGALYILRHDEWENEWEMVLMEIPEPRAGW